MLPWALRVSVLPGSTDAVREEVVVMTVSYEKWNGQRRSAPDGSPEAAPKNAEIGSGHAESSDGRPALPLRGIHARCEHGYAATQKHTKTSKTASHRLAGGACRGRR